MRLMLASPLNSMPQLVFQPALPAFGSSTTAGALVPYKAPEVSDQHVALVVEWADEDHVFHHSTVHLSGLACCAD